MSPHDAVSADSAVSIPEAEAEHLEPGLLPVFRAYVFVRALALILVAMVKLPEIGKVMTTDLLITAGLYVVEALFLLAYLFWPMGQRRMGRWYLPVALIVAAAGPVIEMRYIFTIYQVDEVLDFWLVFPFLTIPLIITAWQYSLREVLLYSVGTTLMEPAIVAIVASTRPISIWFDGRMLVVRMLFLLAIGYIVSYLMTEQRQQRRELAEANRKLILYAAGQEQLATLRERNRLARELHDTLAHTLSGLTVQLDALSSVWQPEAPKAQRLLTHTLETARSGLDETRRALQDLRAAPLEDLGLAQALRSLAEHAAERGSLNLALDVSEAVADLPTDANQVFYRVAQEALENVIKHAEARLVTVELQQQGRDVILVVIDDGRGFVLQDAEGPDRLGIRGMRERAGLIGGHLTITTKPYAGTEVRLSATVGPNRGG